MEKVKGSSSIEEGKACEEEKWGKGIKREEQAMKRAVVRVSGRVMGEMSKRKLILCLFKD